MNDVLLRNRPVFSILITPIKTYSGILKDENKYLNVLLLVACLWKTLSITLNYGESTYIWSSLISSYVTVLCVGYLTLYFIAYLISVSAKILGGRGTTKETYVVLLWSFVPGLFAIFIFIIAVIFFGDNIIKQNTATGNLSIIRSVLLFSNYIAGAWLIYILTNGIRYVHRLPLFKAILALALPILFLFILFNLFSIPKFLLIFFN